MPNKPQEQESDGWDFQRPMAQLHFGALTAFVDPTKPQLGLHNLSVQSQSIAASLFSLTTGSDPAWPATLADAYVRGGDLVATFEPASGWPYAPTIYWRAEQIAPPRGPLAALALLVSIQTNLLDTHPRVRVASQLPAEEVLQLSASQSSKFSAVPLNNERHIIHTESQAAGLLWRLPGGQLSYAELAEQNDFRQLVVEHSDGTCRSEWELFAEFLEKGVIRRARLHAAFLPRENDVALAADLCRSLASRPLPLTT